LLPAIVFIGLQRRKNRRRAAERTSGRLSTTGVRTSEFIDVIAL